MTNRFPLQEPMPPPETRTVITEVLNKPVKMTIINNCGDKALLVETTEAKTRPASPRRIIPMPIANRLI
ncbi:hypothetical protein H6H02_07095 [Coleofasciculus sp. FACHB-1120]|nr:hypothetical protein [Coleofasciculus sp. FACHB-1120]